MAYMMCPHCGEKLRGIKVRTDTETLSLAEIMSRLQEAQERTGLKATYDAVMNLQRDLRGSDDHRKVKALAACYELQEYLANQIAAANAPGELDLDGFTEDIFPDGRE